MALRRAKRGKCKVASEPEVVFDQLRFLTPENEQTFETLIKRRRIWGERQINLHELHPSVQFYSNLLVHEDLGGHKVASSIRGVPFTITRERISKALDVPIICTPTYPYSMSPHVDDVMDVLCGRSVTRGSDRSISSSELTKLNYIFFRIGCHNILPISHIHTIPINRDVPNEDMYGDPTAAIAEDGDDEVDVDTADAAHTSPLPPSLHAMMETIMTTQAAHGQLLHGLLAEVATLRADVADYRHPVPPSPLSDS
nr:hypothetical protein CFP56_70604 [Quercus suber]